MTKNRDSIVDASIPSAGRVYDYYLGGHHNFEVDRQAAEQAIKYVPFIPKAARLQRWCLQDIANELTVRCGYDAIIDFASGLPTQDHIHTVVPVGTTVIYSDYDPVVVEYARDILGNTPDVYFFEADARRPEELLERPELETILNGSRRVGLIYWGIAMFLSDDELSHALKQLYNWADVGSTCAFNAQMADMDPNHPAVISVNAIYKQMGSPAYIRTLQRYSELVQPWSANELGYVPLLEWHGLDQTELGKEDKEVFGPSGAGYGVYLVK